MPIFPEKTRYILVLIERTSDLSQIKGILSNPYYVYRAVNTMQNALEHLHSQRRDQRIDVIMSAVHLENTDSFEFLNRVRLDEKLKSIPFVFVSMRRSDVARYIDHGLSLAARALGATRYLSIDLLSPEDMRLEIDKCIGSAPRHEQDEKGAQKEEWRSFWPPTPTKLPPTPGNTFSY